MIIACVSCGVMFTRRNARHKYCSVACGAVTQTCIVCQQTFLCTATNLARGRGAYCSSPCFHASQIGKRRGEYKPPTECICLVCQKSFLTGGRNRPRRGQSICSVACARRIRRRKSLAHCQPLSVADAAWLAGFLDGEGSIMLITRHQKEGIYLRITYANTHLPTLEHIAQLTGIGSIYAQRKASTVHKTSYAWRCHAVGAEEFLQAVQPYLITKQAQCHLALTCMQKMQIPSLHADTAWQQEARTTMQQLNARGPHGG